MLVQGGRRPGIIAHRIDVAHSIALAGAIAISGSLAEAEVHFIRFPFQTMVNPFIPPTEIIALGGAI
jgi:hypothetical protein